MLEASVQREIRAILEETDLEAKLERAAGLAAAAPAVGRAARSEGGDEGETAPVLRPGRPSGWTVLASHEIPSRPALQTREGRYRLLHSVANIELSAVELALAAVQEFPDSPRDYHEDWLRIAGEEVSHARLVMRRLEELGGRFGTEPVHLGLWETASGCNGLVERMAVVPRMLEARGLDVSARLRDGLGAAGDEESRSILEVIYRDEIGHVAAGTRWFRFACSREGTEPEDRFLEILAAFRTRRRLRPGPVDREGRRKAGFTERELEAVEGRLQG